MTQFYYAYYYVRPVAVKTVWTRDIRADLPELESGYVKCWLPTLSDKNLRIKEELKCQKLNLDEVVSNYEAKLKRKESRKTRILKKVEGTSVGVNASEYITCRKCHYLYCTVWRQSMLMP